ncbi:TPA: hypothetical protein ACGO9Z_002175 [Streptococcus suis]|uniref:hypothetical protein n=1 Tax=Streptococcus suis TaxID=1307 RepID=UPI000CF5690A|nr:hypothetical protein [Streptococcus suis]
MSEYVITVKHNASDEPYLSAIVEDVDGGKAVKRIVQNSNVSDVVNAEHIKSFLAYINNSTIEELPPLDDFIKNGVIVVPAQGKIGDNYITELDF